MSYRQISFGPDAVVPSATCPQPEMRMYGQDSVWPTIPPGTIFLWGTGPLGVGDISSDGYPPLVTGEFCLPPPDADVIRLPDLVKMEEPKNV